MKLGGSLRRRRSGRSREGRGEGTPRLGPKIVAIAGAFALVGWAVGYIVATRLVFPAPPPPGDLFRVPDLSSLSVEEARAVLDEARLEVGSIDSLTHPGVPNDRIVGQAPLPGQVARPGTPIDLTVSLGPQTRAIPDVRGVSAEQATVILEASGFVVGVDSTESEEPRGRVVDLLPTPDTVVPLPATVELVVSSGPPVVAMPFVLGLGREEAVALLDSLGFVVTEVEEVFRFGRDQGIVVEQEPAADTEMRRGETVRLAVGRGGGDGEQ